MISHKKKIRFVASGTALGAHLAGEMVLLDQVSGHYFALNRIGAFAWRHLQNGCTAPALIDAAVDQFDVDGDRAAADFTALLDDLARVGLVREDANPLDTRCTEFVGVDVPRQVYEQPALRCWGTVEQLTATGGGADGDAGSESGGGGVEY